MIFFKWNAHRLLAAAMLAGTICWMTYSQVQAQDTGPARRATATLGAWSERPLAHLQGRENQIQRERTARLDLGERVYAISYKAGFDKDRPGTAFPIEGYIGMPLPSSCNWYHSGFLWVTVNGRDIGNHPIHAIYVAETGTRAIVDVVWKMETMDVRLRFIGLPGGDHIVCEVTVDSPEPLESLKIRTRCYPSFFTSHYKRVGARLIQTPSSTVEQGTKTEGPGAANWWSFYRDDVFDVARGEGIGPCAMLVDPDQVEAVRFDPGSYAVHTDVIYKPGLRKVRIGFWDMKGLSNAEASESFTGNANAFLAQMRTIDSTPIALKSLKLKTMAEECEKALASPVVKKLLNEKMAEVISWLERNRSSASGTPDITGIATQTDILTQIDAYRDFMWEVRLATLISDI